MNNATEYKRGIKTVIFYAILKIKNKKKTRMTTSIRSKAFEKNQKAKECMIIQKKQTTFQKYINRVFNIFTFLPFVAKLEDRQTKYLQNSCDWSDISIRGRENHVSP